MMKKPLLSLLLLASVPLAHAGVVIGGTRFIYNEGQTSINFRVMNEGSLNYLIVTKIAADDGNAAAPFIPTPPLFALKQNKEGIITLTKTGDALPRDRESLFWLSVASIPETQDKQPDNSLQVAVRAHMKLFYRPAGLAGKAADAYKQLSWSRAGANVSVTNPTPWYVTLIGLKSNGATVREPGMVAPFSTRVQPWCPAQGGCDLQWQTLNDYGALLPVIHVSPGGSPPTGHQ